MNINNDETADITTETTDNIIPSTFEEYELVVNENLTVNDEVDTDFKKLALNLKLNKSQVKTLSSWANEKSLESLTKRDESIQLQRTQAIQELKTDWGSMHETNLKKSIATAEKLASFSPDFAEYLNQTNAGDDPKFIKAVFKLGELISEDKLTAPTKNNGSDNRYFGDMPLLTFSNTKHN